MNSQDKMENPAVEGEDRLMTETNEPAKEPQQEEVDESFESDSDDGDYSESESDNEDDEEVEEEEHVYAGPVDVYVDDGEILDDGNGSDNDSFIVLGSSPRSEDGPLREDLCDDKSLLMSAIDELPVSATSALRGHISESPSPNSLMIASNIVTEDKSIGELRNQFGALLDENVVLKEVLRKNNEAMRDQLAMLADCELQVLMTHESYREKVDMANYVTARYNDENALSEENADSAARSATMVGSKKGGARSSSPIEFVASPDEDTVDKLAAQLRLVEQQRRDVIKENMTITWQKSSLEFMLDRNAAEINGLKDALLRAESEAAQLRTQIETLNMDAEDRIRSMRQLEYQVGDRQAQVDELAMDMRRLRAERKGHEEVISDLTKTKDEDDLLISRLVKEKAELQFSHQQYKEDMEKKDLANKNLVSQLTQDKANLQATLEKVHCEFIGKQTRYEDIIHELRDYKECCKYSTQALKESINMKVTHYTNKIEQMMKYTTHLEKTVKQLQEEASDKEGQYKQEIDQLTNEKVKLELTMKRNYNEFTEREKEDQKAIDDLEEVKMRLTQSLAQCQEDFTSEVSLPMQFSISREQILDESVMRNVKKFELTVKHLSVLLNGIIQCLTDNVFDMMCVITSVDEFKQFNEPLEKVEKHLAEVKKKLCLQQSTAMHSVDQVKSVLSVFDDIFKEYCELSNRVIQQENNAQKKELAGSVQTLADALLARESERATLMARVAKLEEEATRLNEQIDNQKAMLQAEHNSNQFINNEIESLNLSLKTAYETIDSLEKQVAQLKPPAPSAAQNIRNAVLGPFAPRRPQALQPAPAHPLEPVPSTSRAPASAPVPIAPPAQPRAPAPVVSAHPALSGGRRPSAARAPPRATTFECPICRATFSALAPLQEHVEYCLN